MVVGLPTSGKTTFTDKFADSFGAPVIDIPKVSEFAKNAKSSHEIISNQLIQLAKTRQFIVVKDYGNTKKERKEIMDVLAKRGYRQFVVWVQTDEPTLRHRLNKKLKPVTPPYSLKEKIESTIKSFETPAPHEVDVVISGRHTFASQARMVLRKLTAKQAPTKKKVAAPKVHAPRTAAPIKTERKSSPARRLSI